MGHVAQGTLLSKLLSNLAAAVSPPPLLASMLGSKLLVGFACVVQPVPVEIQAQLCDDWNSHGMLPGEKLVMRLEQGCWLRGENAIPGILVMTSYQIYFEPANRSEVKVGGVVVRATAAPSFVASICADLVARRA